MDFEKKINFIIFKIHSSRRKMLAEPVIPKFRLDENGEPVEVEATVSSTPASQRIDPQTILISATLSSGIKEIARRLNVSDPVVIDAAYTPESSGKSARQAATLQNATLDEREVEGHEKIALPSNLSQFYVMVPSKLRLIGLISFIMDKFLVNIRKILLSHSEICF